MKTRPKLFFIAFTLTFLVISTALPGEVNGVDNKSLNSGTDSKMELIHLNKDRIQFIYTESGSRFIAWGFNYDHDDSGRLIEDYWQEEWPTIVEDFNELKNLGANLVRIHLQLSKFMEAADKPNIDALNQLATLVELAETTGLYLDITGLGCYHKQDVPGWYDAMDESQRWKVQALFWEEVAKTCAGSNAIFCYDLMNEPFLPGANEKANDWLDGEFGGKYFLQRITLDLKGRTQKQVADAWLRTLVTAIKKHDKRHMITVGAVPWVLTFPKAKPLFYSKELAENLDFVSVHFYPKEGEVDKALTALAAYDIGKPLIIEETSPLYCGIDEFDKFMNKSREISDGYLGFYWGKTLDEYKQIKDSIQAAIMAEWLEYFDMKRDEILNPQRPN